MKTLKLICLPIIACIFILSACAPDPNDPKNITDRLVVLTGPDCKDCRKSIKYLTQFGAPFKVLNINSSSSAAVYFKKLDGKKLPIIAHANVKSEGYDRRSIKKVVDDYFAKNRVIIFTKSSCTWCTQAIGALRKNNVDYTEYHYRESPEVKRMYEFYGGKGGTPLTVVDQTPRPGFGSYYGKWVVDKLAVN